MIVFDTEVFTHMVYGHPRLLKRIRETTDAYAIPLITRIEVLQGRFAAVLKASHGKETRVACQRLEDDEAHLGTFSVLPFSDDAVDVFDRLRDDRRTRRIGRPDLLIASITLSKSATLVTRNLRHFRLVPGLRVENWMD